MLSSKLLYKTSEKYSSELHLNYALRKPEYHNIDLSNDKLTEYEEKDWEFTANFINALALSKKNTLRVGALYNYWIAPEGKRFYYGKKAEVHTISGVVTQEHQFGRLLLDAGFRLTSEYYAEWGGFNIEGSGGKFSKVAAIKDEWQSPVWQATSGVTYSLQQGSSLHYTLAAGSVNPRKGALNSAGNSPDNETRINMDLGFVKNFKQGGKISVAAFWVNRRNAIEYSGETANTGNDMIVELYRNTDKRNYGLETEFRSPTLGSYFSFFTNLTLMKGESKESGSWKYDDEIPRIIANSGANFQKKRWDINGYLHHTGSYKNDRFVSKAFLQENGKAPLGRFITFDTTVGYTFGDKTNVRISGEIKNLFDEKYQTVPGYPNLGRLLSLGVEIKL